MNNIVKGIVTTLLIFLSFSIFADEFNCLIPLNPNSEAFIYESRVNLRSAPSLKSDKVGVALLGEKVKVLDLTDKSETLYGLTALWYKIEWKDKECYVWGGLLSTMGVAGDFDHDAKSEQLIGQERTKKLYMDSEQVYWSFLGNDDLKASLKLCRAGQVVNANPLQFTPSYT